MIARTPAPSLLCRLGAEAACADVGGTRSRTGNLVGGVVAQGPFPPTGIRNLVVNGLAGAPLNRDALSFAAGLQRQVNERLGFGVVVPGDVGDRTRSIGSLGRIVHR